MGLMRLLIYASLGLVAYVIFKKITSGIKNMGAEEEDDRLGRLVQDPQCGVYVDSKEAVKRKRKGGDVFFCSQECADKFTEGA